MRRILIAGCGYVGAELARRLVAAGDEVFALRRGEELPEGVHPLRADLGRIETLGVLPTELDGVVFAAGAGSPDPDAYRALYLDGLGNLLRALRENAEAPAHVVFCSSTAVYGQERGEWVDETSPTHPNRFSGDVMLAAERLLLASGLPGTSVRFGGIYGPGRARWIERVRDGSALARPGPPHYTNRIHRDDAAGALQHLLALESPEALYLGVDSDPVDETELLHWLARELRVPPPKELAAADDRGSGRRAGSKRCSNRRLLGTGFSLEYPGFREGYGALLREGPALEL